jgi:hypothetical protein
MISQAGFFRKEVLFMKARINRSNRGQANGSRDNPVNVELLENRRHLDGALAADVSVVMSGLDSPRGLNFGPQGALYVTEAGRGGGVGAPSIVQRGTTFYYGATGAVSRLWNGEQERVATGLPSLAMANGNRGEGAHDISFNGVGNAYVTIGFEGDPNQRSVLGPTGAGFAKLIHLKPNGRWSTVADIGNYEIAHNPDGLVVDSNPFSVLAGRGRDVVLTDSGGNSLLSIDKDGNVSTLAVMPLLPLSQSNDQHAVPTGFTLGSDGAYYVGILGGFPFRDGVANVYRVVPGEAPTVFRGGFKTIIDIDFDQQGNLYVLQHSSGATLLNGPGSLIRVAPDGTRSTVLDNLTAPTSIAIGRDGALYVTNFGVTAGAGQVLRVVVSEPGGAGALARLLGENDPDHPAKDDGGVLGAVGDVLS